MYKLQHDRVQAFRPTGLFIILKGGRTQLWRGAAAAFLEFYPLDVAHCRLRQKPCALQTEERTFPSLIQRGESASSVYKKHLTYGGGAGGWEMKEGGGWAGRGGGWGVRAMGGMYMYMYMYYRKPLCSIQLLGAGSCRVYLYSIYILFTFYSIFYSIFYMFCFYILFHFLKLRVMKILTLLNLRNGIEYRKKQYRIWNRI